MQIVFLNAKDDIFQPPKLIRLLCRDNKQIKLHTQHVLLCYLSDINFSYVQTFPQIELISAFSDYIYISYVSTTR